jgi:ribose transport system permease protein
LTELLEKVAATPVANTPEQAASTRRLTPWLRGWLRHPMLAVLAVMLIATTFVNDHFWSVTNIQNLMMQNAPLTVVAVGMTLVIISGGFDLSVGSIFAAGAVFYVSMDGTMPVGLAIPATVLIGLVFGLVNGVVVNVLGVNPFVATLGSSSVIAGIVSLYYSHSSNKFVRSTSFRYLGTVKWGFVPVSVAAAAAVVLVAALALGKSTYGRGIYATGGNIHAARLNGIRVGMISASTFMIIGALSALGGVMLSSQVATGEPSFGGNLTLDAIAVVIIGGTSLLGGEGAVWRTVVGIAIFAILTNTFAARSLEPSLQSVIKGLLVIAVVAADVWFYRRRSQS